MSLRKNVILEGVFGSEAMDSSGEVLDIKGADISELQTGKSILNTEHSNPEDIAKEDKKNDKGPKGFETVVGRVITAKKIFSEEDCISDKEVKAFRLNSKKPIIYGSVEIYDGSGAPENARAAAALARMFANDPDGPALGLSVEGSTLKREGNVLKETCIRRMALTMKPCNKQAFVYLKSDSAKDSPSQVNKSEYGTFVDGYEPLFKSVSMQNFSVVNTFNDFGLLNAVESLKKALTAGGQNAAPSSLTGGSALQKESNMATLARKMAKTPINKDSVKKAVPSLSDEHADLVAKALKKYMFEKASETCEKIYKSFN